MSGRFEPTSSWLEIHIKNKIRNIWIPTYNYYNSSSSVLRCNDRPTSFFPPLPGTGRYTGWKVISSQRQSQKVSLSIPDMFVIDHKENVSLINQKIGCLIKQGLLFFVIYHKPFCYCIAGMQECLMINCRKGCLYDGCLWLITEVRHNSQKTSEVNHKNMYGNSVVYYIVLATLNY